MSSLIRSVALMLIFVSAVLTSFAQEVYKLGPDSFRQEGVPVGKVNGPFVLESKKIYPGTFRDYLVYVPAQYDPNTPAALMIYQDGGAYANENGEYHATIVMDNLIHRKEMPVTIAIFVNPGHNSATLPENRFRASNRSIEYDDLSDNYVRFLLEELIPEVKKSYNISDDRNMHAIAGLSSGAICAFTAAWLRPDYFSKVLSHIGSYTNIRGGHVYPALVRANPKKDIRIFLQDGSNDLNNQFGNWWLANQQMASSLAFKGYDYQFAAGVEGHNGKHGGAILPESLKWLWAK